MQIYVYIITKKFVKFWNPRAIEDLIQTTREVSTLSSLVHYKWNHKLLFVKKESNRYEASV